MTNTQKVAIVTGGGAGIGASIIKQLPHDGFAVVIADCDETNASTLAQEIIVEGKKAVAVTGDVANYVSYLASTKSDYMTGQSVQMMATSNLFNYLVKSQNSSHCGWSFYFNNFI